MIERNDEKLTRLKLIAEQQLRQAAARIAQRLANHELMMGWHGELLPTNELHDVSRAVTRLWRARQVYEHAVEASCAEDFLAAIEYAASVRGMSEVAE